MTEPVPSVCLPDSDPQPVISLEALRNTPMLPRHLAAACGRDHASFGVGRQLNKEACRVGCRAHDACSRSDRSGRVVARNDNPPPGRIAPQMAARKGNTFGKWHIHLSLFETCGVDDL